MRVITFDPSLLLFVIIISTIITIDIIIININSSGSIYIGVYREFLCDFSCLEVPNVYLLIFGTTHNPLQIRDEKMREEMMS